MEYIEREAAIKAVAENDCEGYATLAIKAIPAADVVPVRHGRWIKYAPHNSDMMTCFVINQKIQGGKESICKSCVHRFVCRGYDNQPCIECNHFLPVVRCGECKHWKRIRNDCILASCELYALVRSEDFFCADGERKDGDEE